jgi:hypothetical protein
MPPDQHLKPTAALALSLSLLAAPAAAAGAKPQSTRSTAAPTIVRITSPDGRFDWGDAGIGAVGGFAVSMIAVGGALVASARRPRPLGRQERRSPAPQPFTSHRRRQR